MTITSSLPPATEARLRVQAEAAGKNIELLVIEAVEARLRLAELSLSSILAPVHADVRASGLTEAGRQGMLQQALDDVREARSAKDNGPAGSSPCSTAWSSSRR